MHRFHVFPRFALVACFPALCTGCMFSRASHWFHVFPRCAPAAFSRGIGFIFPALRSGIMISRAWNQLCVFSRLHVFALSLMGSLLHWSYVSTLVTTWKLSFLYFEQRGCSAVDRGVPGGYTSWLHHVGNSTTGWKLYNKNFTVLSYYCQSFLSFFPSFLISWNEQEKIPRRKLGWARKSYYFSSLLFFVNIFPARFDFLSRSAICLWVSENDNGSSNNLLFH